MTGSLRARPRRPGPGRRDAVDSAGQRRPPPVKAGRHLEGVSELEDTQLALMSPDDLQTHRQALHGVKPAGTEIAGSPVTVMSEQLRIQSMYVGSDWPSISLI